MKWAVLTALAATVAFAQDAVKPDGGISAATLRTAQGRLPSTPSAAAQQQPATRSTAVQGRAGATPTAAAEQQPAPATPATQQPPQPAQPPALDRTAEVTALQSELQALRAEAQTTNAKLQSAVNELQQVKQQLAQQQQQTARQQDVTASQREAAVSIGAVDQQLSTGAVPTDAALQSLESTLGPSGRANLEYARTALQNGDVATARSYLSQAASDAQAGR